MQREYDEQLLKQSHKNQSHKNRTIKQDVFFSTLLSFMIVILIFSVMLSIFLYQTYSAKAADIIKQRNYAVNYYIDGYFAEINNTIEILSKNPDVQNYPWIDVTSRRKVLELYSKYLNANKNITYIYSAYETGELAITNYTPPEGYNPLIRPWYISAIEEKLETATGIPYQEAISGEWLLSTSKALSDGRGGFSGVVSCDSSIGMVTNILKNQKDEIYDTSYSYVTTPEGEIILHHNSAYIKKHLSELTGIPHDFNQTEGLFHYKLGDAKKIAYYSKCEEAEWMVITVVEKSEITKPIIKRIAFSILGIGVIAVLVGFFQSIILSKRFSTPIQELYKQVDTVIHGEGDNRNNFNYPNNEIGIMAEKISQLAVSELYRTSNELKKVNKELQEKNRELTALSTTDRLTGLFNRNKMDAEMDRFMQNAIRYNTPFSLVIFDIDLFKKINDDLGHQAGDTVLKEFAHLLLKNLRPTDLAFRWGGEEFIVLCPETNLKQAEALSLRLCLLIENHDFDVHQKITISGGISEFQNGDNSDSILKRADENLYKAKRRGRNCVIA